MREQLVPILEKHGVDLVLTGHSHSYERSFLLNGHYGFSSSLTNSMIIDKGDGRSDGDGSYKKPLAKIANAGTVYVLSGNAGKLSRISSKHPVMYMATDQYYGSLIIDIQKDTLSVKMIDDKADEIDYFEILKTNPNSISISRAEDESKVRVYPNPSRGSVTVSLTDSYPELNVKVLNSDGKIVFNNRFVNTNKIDLNINQKPGVYFLELKNGNELINVPEFIIE
jgi:hypothetical protein